MKKNNTLWLLLLALCSLFASCKKEPVDELSKLPPATQTGANTFGCLLNGKAWVAHTDCKYLCDPAFKLRYDNSEGGNIFASVILSNSENIKQSMSFAIDSTNTKTYFNYQVLGTKHMGFTFSDNNLFNGCGFIFSADSTTSTIGIINLSRYDLQNGVVSGTFEFTLSKSGCETINATNGRFDFKLF